MNIAAVIEKKLRKINKFDGAKVNTDGVNITAWDVQGVLQPSSQDLTAWETEVVADDQTEKQGMKNAKKALMTKLGLTKQELKALIALIKDGNDD